MVILNAHYVYIWDRVDREQSKQLLAVLIRLRCPSYYSTKLRALQSSDLGRKCKLAPQSSSSSKGKHQATPRGAHTDLKSKILRQLLNIHIWSLTSILEHFHSNLYYNQNYPCYLYSPYHHKDISSSPEGCCRIGGLHNRLGYWPPTRYHSHQPQLSPSAKNRVHRILQVEHSKIINTDCFGRCAMVQSVQPSIH